MSVGVYCLNGIPNSEVRPDPERAHELFQYAATIFGDPNAQYYLAQMYKTGAGGLAKDNVAAVRWLAVAAQKGHAPSQALLGHMLFIGDGVPHQRARGLMWLGFANDAALGVSDVWIRDLYQRDFASANEEERQAAADLHDARVKGPQRFSPLRDIVKGARKPSWPAGWPSFAAAVSPAACFKPMRGFGAPSDQPSERRAFVDLI